MPTPAEMKRALLSKRERPYLSKENAVSSGSTLLNLACTDHPALAFMKGGYYYLVGDSTSGKTWLSLTCFAEAVHNKAFKDYRFIFDDVEGGALMDIEYYFGKEVARRMELPGLKNGEPVCSDTVESFYHNIMDALSAGPPFIYVLDSQDSLTSGASIKKFNKQRTQSEAGDDVVGSYGDGKAKYHSEHLRLVLSGLRKKRSILIIIGQTRDNLGMSFAPKTRAGGRSLRFYANLEIWTSVAEKITRNVRGKPRTVGVTCMAEVKKNRVTGKVGKDRSVSVPIYYDFGIDDIASCVDYLVDEKHWLKKKKADVKVSKNGAPSKNHIIDAPDIMFEGTRTKLLNYIEEEGLERKVQMIVGRVWREIEEESKTNRKRRYE